MKTFKTSEDLINCYLNKGDVIFFGDLKYRVAIFNDYYFLNLCDPTRSNDWIFKVLKIPDKREFCKRYSDITYEHGDFPFHKTLVGLTSTVLQLMRLFEYDNQTTSVSEETSNCVLLHNSKKSRLIYVNPL